MRNELKKLKKEDLINKILELKEDLDFTKTLLKSSKSNENMLEKENKYLKEEVKELEGRLDNKGSEILELVEENMKLEDECRVQKLKNERGAGRKKKYDNKQIAEILEARKQNKSMRVIAKEFNCSLGLVQKIINEHKGEL